MKTLDLNFQSPDGINTPNPNQVSITGNFDFIFEISKNIHETIIKYGIKDITSILPMEKFEPMFYNEHGKRLFYTESQLSITVFRNALMCLNFLFEDEELYTEFFTFPK